MPLEPARVHVDFNRTIGPISPLIFGGFAEHLGRCVYEGIYEPGSPLSDKNGFRTDVLAALRDEMKLSILRYPGGNFVSGYNWRDGVGPASERPTRLEHAWKSLESNRFGTNEFMTYCKALGALPMLGLNFGTATLQDSLEYVEYCNAPTGSKFGDLRAAHGFTEPHNVRYWCLGNEMDGPWQIGHLDSNAYAIKALQTAKIIKSLCPDAQLTLCGSSHPSMPTYPDWDRHVLETCWEHVEFISLHDYADNWKNDTDSFLASGVKFENHLATIAATCRYVKSKLRSKHDVHLAWDEWNVWYKDRNGDGKWQHAPHLCEEVYNLEDALVVAQWLNTFIRNCDVLKIACFAQIVNVISPLLTTRDGLLKQTTFYPFALFARFASGLSLDLLTTAPTHETKQYGVVPLLDTTATYNPETNRVSVFLVNRSTTDVLPVEVRCSNSAAVSFADVHQLSGRDPKAANSWEQPQRIIPQKLGAIPIKDGVARVLLPPLSFTVLSTT